MGTWNDDRLDRRDQELRDSFAKVDERFQEVNRRFDKIDERLAEMPTRKEMNAGFAELRSEMNEGFAESRAAYASLTRTLMAGSVAIIVALIGFHG